MWISMVCFLLQIQRVNLYNVIHIYILTQNHLQTIKAHHNNILYNLKMSIIVDSAVLNQHVLKIYYSQYSKE